MLISATDNPPTRVLQQLRLNQFPFTDSLIHLFRGGSELHGAKLEGKQDEDWYGVFMESAEMVVGLKEYPHYVWSSRGDGERNQPGDMDITLYSMRKWVRLASGGNPTCLAFLFAPNVLDMKYWPGNQWKLVMEHQNLLLARNSCAAFRGFATAQLKRVIGEAGQGRHGQRPELETQFGFDTKAAFHIIRLLGEGIELMRTGRITYPRPNRELLIAIREGHYDLAAVKGMAEGLFEELEQAHADSDLPASCDLNRLSIFVTEFYLDYWFPVRSDLGFPTLAL